MVADRENGLNDNQDDHEEGDFAALLDNYITGMNEDIKVGDRIQGKIIAISADSVDIDTGTKLDGVVSKTELLNADGEFTLRKGDVVDLYVVSMSESEIQLSKALVGVDSSHLLFDAFKNNIPVEGKVTAICKGGFQVDVMKKRAFCPISQMDVQFVKEPEKYVGNSFHFVIKKFENHGRNIVVSRRDLLEKDLEKARQKFLQDLTVGKFVEGRVVRIQPFGLFIELFPGVEGMVHISELAWSRVATPEEVLHMEQTATFKVLAMDQDAAGKIKISLSLKQVSGDPWTTIESKFHTGDQVSGKITRCAAFGAFVEIAPGLEGLVHISEMSYLKRVSRPEDLVAPGDIVAVLIKEIDTHNKRIALSMRDAEGDPWVDIQQKYKPGQIIAGTFVKKEKFGYFINLEPGVTGLYPKSKMDQSAEAVALDTLKPGQTVTVVIEAVLAAERRISLGPARSETADDWRQFTAEGNKTVGDLGAKLQQALSGKGKKKG